jgi:hypothetical protein
MTATKNGERARRNRKYLRALLIKNCPEFLDALRAAERQVGIELSRQPGIGER